jgi:hypothetical protein
LWINQQDLNSLDEFIQKLKDNNFFIKNNSINFLPLYYRLLPVHPQWSWNHIMCDSGYDSRKAFSTSLHFYLPEYRVSALSVINGIILLSFLFLLVKASTYSL